MALPFADAESLSRAVGRPPTFSGSDSEWEEWAFVMRSYCALHDIADEAVFTTIETAPGGLENVHLGPGHSAKSISLFYILAAHTRGAASVSIRSAGIGNGYAAWRRLADRYSMPTAGRQFALLNVILKPQEWAKDSQGFEASLSAWELQLSRY